MPAITNMLDYNCRWLSGRLMPLAFQLIACEHETHYFLHRKEMGIKLTSILLFTLKNPSASVTTVGFDAPTAMIAP